MFRWNLHFVWIPVGKYTQIVQVCNFVDTYLGMFVFITRDTYQFHWVMYNISIKIKIKMTDYRMNISSFWPSLLCQILQFSREKDVESCRWKIQVSLLYSWWYLWKCQEDGLCYVEVDPSGEESWKLDPVVKLLKEGAVGVIPTDTVYVAPLSTKQITPRPASSQNKKRKKGKELWC